MIALVNFWTLPCKIILCSSDMPTNGLSPGARSTRASCDVQPEPLKSALNPTAGVGTREASRQRDSTRDKLGKLSASCRPVPGDPEEFSGPAQA